MWRWIVDNYLWSSIYFYHYLLLDLFMLLTDEFVKHVTGSVIKETLNAFNVFTDMGALILIPLNRKKGWWLKSEKNGYASVKYFVLVYVFTPNHLKNLIFSLYPVFRYLGRLSVHCLTQLSICQMRIIHIYLLWRSLTWANVSVKLISVWWQRYWREFLRIFFTFPLVSTAIFATVSFRLAAVHWR